MLRTMLQAHLVGLLGIVIPYADPYLFRPYDNILLSLSSSLELYRLCMGNWIRHPSLIMHCHISIQLLTLTHSLVALVVLLMYWMRVSSPIRQLVRHAH
jgi:hypothetical protein